MRVILDDFEARFGGPADDDIRRPPVSGAKVFDFAIEGCEGIMKEVS